MHVEMINIRRNVYKILFDRNVGNFFQTVVQARTVEFHYRSTKTHKSQNLVNGGGKNGYENKRLWHPSFLTGRK